MAPSSRNETSTEAGLSPGLSYEDYANLPDDGRRYEILNGQLFATPPPGPLHQRVSRRLYRRLDEYFIGRGRGEVFAAPVAVILSPHDVVQPDLVVVTEPSQVSSLGIEGAPTIVVEILSPPNVAHDRVRKARRYAALAVPHYWIVDPERRLLECSRLEGCGYRAVVTAEGKGVVAHPHWVGLRIDLANFWR